MIELRPRPPFSLELTVWALRRRSRNRIDRWVDGRYRRAIQVGGRAITVEVEQRGGVDRPVLTVRNLTGGRLSNRQRTSIESQVVRMLGVDVDLAGFYELADTDARVGPIASRLRGVKPPRFPTLFEALVNAISNQQISLEVGIELLNRFTDRFGRRPADDRGITAFPEPDAVLGASVGDFRELGFSTRKAEYILGVAHSIATGALDETRLAAAGRHGVTDALVGLRGIGRWSAEYVLLRGMGDIGVFPADDVGARNKLREFFALADPPSRAEILALMEPWRPYAGMVYFHLLLVGLVDRGEIVA